jgi:hypothetical protein
MGYVSPEGIGRYSHSGGQGMFQLGENLSMENADGVKITGQITYVLQVNGIPHYVVRLETGVEVPYSEQELTDLVVFTW